MFLHLLHRLTRVANANNVDSLAYRFSKESSLLVYAQMIYIEMRFRRRPQVQKRNTGTLKYWYPQQAGQDTNWHTQWPIMDHIHVATSDTITHIE